MLQDATTISTKIPEKKYFTIGEVSKICEIKPHVLRYWEQEFKQIKPVKRKGNRRYYQKHDIITIKNIAHLLYNKGFTITGARKYLDEEHHTKISDNPSLPLTSNQDKPKEQQQAQTVRPYASAPRSEAQQETLKTLKEVLVLLS